MAGKKGKSSGSVDRQGGIAKAKEAARRGASERAMEARDAGDGAMRGGAERSESRDGAAGGQGGGAGRRSGRDG